MRKYKVIKRMIYNGIIREKGTILENLMSEEEKRMLERNLIEQYKENELKPDDSGAETENGDVEEQIINLYTEFELKSFDRTRLLEIAEELSLNVQNNIGVDKLVTKILDEYKVIENESQDENPE